MVSAQLESVSGSWISTHAQLLKHIETTVGLKMCMAILTCTLDSLNLLAIEAWDLFKNVVM